MNPPYRVGAISHSQGNIIYFFGYGTYVGREVPPPGIKFMGVDMNEADSPNPRINLDNGKVVWGCECWWAPESLIRKKLEGKQVVEVDIWVERSKAWSQAYES